ncbi:MAG: hypothetical protein G01um101433_54 [Parcubacteria group bacterium Gr01-1014_33]|nr:MAG: hypothetical protein G01um101433_54 [Parcubacteria group bacterium Gr01-1014_33]
MKNETPIQQAQISASPQATITAKDQFSISLLDVIVAIGVASMIGGLIYIGKKLQILDTLTITTEKIKTNLSAVANHMIKNYKFDPSELHTYSPVQLTEVGNNFIRTLGFDNVFEKNKSDFFSFIDSENPKLKYDVELAAIKSISVLYEKEYINFLKVFFYNHPARNIENTAPTLGIYIRDKYLAEHPEITQ